MTTMDWSVGHYEHTAARLLRAARTLVDHAHVSEGERVVDVGCGTGNATLLAAARGAHVTGVDPAARLLEVARAAAAERGLEATFALGDAANLPVADGEADVVLSAFGVIFAPDPAAAAREMARIAAPEGRIVISAWIPAGPISAATRIAAETVRAALGAPAGPPPFAWHDRDALAGVFAPVGFSELTLSETTYVFTAPSARAYVDDDLEHHPVAIAGRAVLDPRGESDALRDRMVAVLEEGNEDPDAFRVTSRYVVAVARRGQSVTSPRRRAT
jgi:SAM-dependent methyltransferase